MSDPISPDGYWRWDGQQWVPTGAHLIEPDPEPEPAPVYAAPPVQPQYVAPPVQPQYAAPPAAATQYAAVPQQTGYAPYSAAGAAGGSSSSGALGVLALVASLVSVGALALQVGGDTRQAFGDQFGGPGWYDDTWFICVQAGVSLLALVLAVLAIARSRGALTAFVLALAVLGFSQGGLQLYYRIVVYHFGYDIPL